MKDCERKHAAKESRYATLGEAINDRLRDAVGEAHWSQAKQIQKRVILNQARRKRCLDGEECIEKRPCM